MAGSVQYHKSAKRWYIYIYWQGKRHKLWRDYHTFQPFITKSRALLYNAVRHSFGCQLLDLGYEMDLVRQLLGHTKTEMTMRYAERSNPTITKALEGRRARVIAIKGEK